jgi:phenylacetate-CoA ligase
MVSMDMSADSAVDRQLNGRRFEQLIHRGLYVGIQRLRRRPVDRYIRELSEWDTLDAAALENMKRTKLLDMLSFAYEHVPFYSTGPWKKAVKDRPERLESWPVLPRGTLLDRPEMLIRRGNRHGLFARRSSASTGVPVKVYWNLEGLARSWAAEYQPMSWYRIPIGVRTLRMWGSSRALEAWVLNRHFVPAHDLTPERLERAVRYLETRKPPLIWGTPSAVSELARHVRARGASSGPLVPYVKVGGEQLYAFQREEIEYNLGARLIEAYGCTEVGSIASECPHGSMHILANVHVEIFRDGAPVPAGEFGEIVATTLINTAMPLVRVRIGDMGRISPEPCRCGRPQPVLTELRGRSADLLLATDGSALHSSVLGDALRRYAGEPPLGLAQTFMFAQIDRRRWRVEVEAPKLSETSALQHQVLALLAETFGPGCDVEVELVPKILKEPSGKYRYYRTIGNSGSLGNSGGLANPGGAAAALH